MVKVVDACLFEPDAHADAGETGAGDDDAGILRRGHVGTVSYQLATAVTRGYARGAFRPCNIPSKSAQPFGKRSR